MCTRICVFIVYGRKFVECNELPFTAKCSNVQFVNLIVLMLNHHWKWYILCVFEVRKTVECTNNGIHYVMAFDFHFDFRNVCESIQLYFRCFELKNRFYFTRWNRKWLFFGFLGKSNWNSSMFFSSSKLQQSNALRSWFKYYTYLCIMYNSVFNGMRQ